MNGTELIRNLIDELIRAREIVEEQMKLENDDRASYLSDLVNDIDVDLARFYDVEDSIIAMVEDIEVE